MPQQESEHTYESIRKLLDLNGRTIEYDTLMQIYRTLVTAPDPIARKDRLIAALIDQRNENPRVDQMILIFSAEIIGASKYPVPNVYHLFETILNQDDDRLNTWVLSFVAEAIGDYAEDIPDGDRLADLAERRLEQLQSASGPSKEYFGFHFLPPPKSNAIRAYFAGLQDRRTRERERRYYYSMIHSGILEKAIEAQLKQLQTQGLPGAGESPGPAMQYLFRHRDWMH